MAKIVYRMAHHVDLTVPRCKHVNLNTLDDSLYPMNLSTFSEMKRTLPSSAMRKKNPSMDSRWGRPSHRNGGSLFSPLLTGTSAILEEDILISFQVVQQLLPPVDDDVPQSSSSFFDSSGGNTEGERVQIFKYSNVQMFKYWGERVQIFIS